MIGNINHATLAVRAAKREAETRLPTAMEPFDDEELAAIQRLRDELEELVDFMDGIGVPT